MKYYSTILNKLFDSSDDLNIAEAEYEAEKEKKDQLLKEKTAAVSKDKKELSNAIDAAEEKLSLAYKEYETAKEEVKKILEESNKKMEAILTPAKEAVVEAQKNKYNAISNFNKKYGPYTTIYSGDRAYAEFKRTSDWFNNLFNRFFF